MIYLFLGSTHYDSGVLVEHILSQYTQKLYCTRIQYPINIPHDF